MVASQLPVTATEAFNSVCKEMAPIHIVDYDTPNATRPAGMVRVSTPVTEELTAELDGATEYLGVASDEILLAALARTIAKTLGDGVVPVDVASERGSMLDAVPLLCATTKQADATEMLGGVHRLLTSATESVAEGMSEVYFNYLGEVSESIGAGPRPGGATRARARPRVEGLPLRGSGACRLVVRHQPLRALHRRGTLRAVPALGL